MKLNNPPVIQTWIGFKFSPSPGKPHWDFDSANEFLARYADSLPHRDALIETTFEFQQISGTRLGHQVSQKNRVDKAVARSDDRNHWLQLADDQMVYNQTRGNAYLGYEALRDESLAKLVDYVDYFRPNSLMSTELHYVDLIEIPIPPSRKIELQDFFNLRVEMPEIFGDTWHFSTQLFVHPGGSDLLEVKLQSIPPDDESQTYRFRFDWHIVCHKIPTLDVDLVRSRLDQAHTCLLDYFRASITDRTWQLFQPSDEG